jgi:flagellar motor switch protein FliN/FliY
VPGEVDESEGRKSYLEILRQSCGELARSTSSRWGMELEPPAGIEGLEPPAEIEFYRVEAVQPEATLPPLLIAVSGEPQDPIVNPNGADAQQRSEMAVACADSRRSKTFDLLMGVELPVSVSFGRVRLPLKDVLKLTAGSIIELNRTVDEPVEVIVNNCVVARGEVVVVEGNYGVRIHQIMSRQQRLETLP